MTAKVTLSRFLIFFVYCGMPDSLHTKKNKENLLAALEESLGVVTTACKLVGVDRRTYYRYYNDDPEFKKAVDALADVALDFAESALHTNIKEGNVTAQIFYLKTKGKRRGYVEKQEVDLNHSGEINLPQIKWGEDTEEK